MQTFPFRVFISHAHEDKAYAVKLNKILVDGGAHPILDEDNIEAGENLPDKVTELIRDSDRFLLVWSGSASRSNWVKAELKFAKSLNKRIVPYQIDQTQLPPILGEVLCITKQDEALGFPLLAKELSLSFSSFAGNWEVRVGIPGIALAEGIYLLEVKRPGQILGSGRIIFQQGIALGFEDILNIKVPVSGNWSYNLDTKIITSNFYASAFGQAQHDTIQIKLTGQAIEAGRDMGGRAWSFRRLPDATPI